MVITFDGIIEHTKKQRDINKLHTYSHTRQYQKGLKRALRTHQIRTLRFDDELKN